MWFIVLWLACAPKEEPPATTGAPAEVPPDVQVTEPEPPEGLTERMFSHFGHATSAQHAVIAGDLPAAKAAAAALASLPPLEGVTAAWQADFNVLQARASDVAGAPTLAKAASAVAALGEACGACHAREGKGPNPPVDELGSIYAAPQEPMARHQWATNWMWFGVIGADNAAYDAGLTILAEPPTWDPRSDNPTFSALQTKLLDLSQKAAADRSTANRTQVYGEVLGTCAACHARYRK